MKEINKAKKSLTASSHFRTDGHVPDVPLSLPRDSTTERGKKMLNQK